MTNQQPQAGDGRRLALLVNPTVGRRAAGEAAQVVADRLGGAGYDVSRLQGLDAEDAAAIALQTVADGYDVLTVMGGDGMVHIGLQAVANSATRLGVIPTGTGNDTARYLGLPLGEPAKAAEVIVAGQTRTVDAGRIGEVYFSSVLATGFDSLVSERANRMRWPRGQMRYNLATAAELRVFRPLPYLLELDGREVGLEAMLVAIGNGPSYGGGLRICEGAEVDDGQLDVVVIKPISKVELVKVYPQLFKGTHVTHPAYERYRVRQVSVAAPGIVAYADGERVGTLPLTVDAAPGAFTVFAPR
ncbi:MAG: diacylglycerol kinase [Nocardioidaceae bacterium]